MLAQSFLETLSFLHSLRGIASDMRSCFWVFVPEVWSRIKRGRSARQIWRVRRNDKWMVDSKLRRRDESEVDVMDGYR